VLGGGLFLLALPTTNPNDCEIDARVYLGLPGLAFLGRSGKVSKIDYDK